jgi:hypothetical protein
MNNSVILTIIEERHNTIDNNVFLKSLEEMEENEDLQKM